MYVFYIIISHSCIINLHKLFYLLLVHVLLYIMYHMHTCTYIYTCFWYMYIVCVYIRHHLECKYKDFLMYISL